MSKVIISLTTTSERITLCRATLSSLVTQKKLPDKIIVWISQDSYLRDKGITNVNILSILTKGLSKDLLALIECKCIDNTGPYRKLMPILKIATNTDIIVTCDDDIFYSDNWLATLIDGFDPKNKIIHASRVRLIKKNVIGGLTGYIFWPLIKDSIVMSENWIITYGGGSVMCRDWFPDNIIYDESYITIAPTSDDIWYSKICKMSGLKVKVIPQALEYLNFFEHSDGLVIHNVPQSVSLLKKFKKIIIFYPLNYLRIKRYGNDVAYDNVEKYFNNKT